MAKSSIDIAESLARLSAATIFELRGEWRRLHRAPIDDDLASLIARAAATPNMFLAVRDDSIDAVASRLGVRRDYVAVLVRLSYLSPEIVGAILVGQKVGSFRRWPLHDVLDRLTHIGDVYGSLASDLTLHIRRLENGLERPRGRSRPAPRHLASLVAADAFAG